MTDRGARSSHSWLAEIRAENPAKREVERYWLWFTLVWGAAAGGVMLSGLAERWSDRELLPFGLVLGLGAVVPPALFPRSADERARGLLDRTATRLGLSVIGFSFLMNYFCTPFFYDVLHMHYGFNSVVTVRQNPLFLYFLTIAYFATYSALLLAAHRISKRLGALSPRALARLPVIAAPFAVAGLETALNANPFMKKLFCYDDLGFALSFGTLSYGACFCFMLPVWRSIDETPRERPTGRDLVVRGLAAMMGIVVTFEILRHLVAPSFTEVMHGAPGLGFTEGTCLAR